MIEGKSIFFTSQRNTKFIAGMRTLPSGGGRDWFSACVFFIIAAFIAVAYGLSRLIITFDQGVFLVFLSVVLVFLFLWWRHMFCLREVKSGTFIFTDDFTITFFETWEAGEAKCEVKFSVSASAIVPRAFKSSCYGDAIEEDYRPGMSLCILYVRPRRYFVM